MSMATDRLRTVGELTCHKKGTVRSSVFYTVHAEACLRILRCHSWELLPSNEHVKTQQTVKTWNLLLFVKCVD
jgi:hypothetical protein